MARPVSDMRQWAAIGARQRLIEITAEVEAICRAFPELRGSRSGTSPSRPRGMGAKVESQDPGQDQTARRGRRRRRRTMSAEARKRISDAQKARWARQKGTAPPAETAPANRVRKNRNKKK